jgi:hypothetical protein
LCTAQQNEFDKYGPFGSQVFTDLKVALEIEKNVYKMDKLWTGFTRSGHRMRINISGIY